MFGRFRKRNCHQRCGREVGEEVTCCAHPLSDFAAGASVIVIANKDRKSLEMGLFTGANVTVLKNRPRDGNMLVAAGESRYIIDKIAAAKIQVR